MDGTTVGSSNFKMLGHTYFSREVIWYREKKGIGQGEISSHAKEW